MGCSTGLYTILFKKAFVEGSTHFKEMHHSFSRDSCKVFERVLIQGFEPRMSISKSVLHIHWLPMFLHLFSNPWFSMIFPMKTARNDDLHHICHHFPKHFMAPWPPGPAKINGQALDQPSQSLPPDPLDPLGLRPTSSDANATFATSLREAAAGKGLNDAEKM